MLNKKILLITGHGGNDNGACANGYIEQWANIDIARGMYNYLKQRGIDVTIEPSNGNLEYEVAYVNKNKFDTIISIHTNAGGGDGWEGFYYSTDKEAYNLLCNIESEVVKIGQGSRGVKTGNQFRIINSVVPLSVIIEGYFLDNLKDVADFNTVAKRENLGVAYAKGVLSWMGYKEQTSPPQPSNKEKVEIYLGGKKYTITEE